MMMVLLTSLLFPRSISLRKAKEILSYTLHGKALWLHLTGPDFKITSGNNLVNLFLALSLVLSENNMLSWMNMYRRTEITFFRLLNQTQLIFPNFYTEVIKLISLNHWCDIIKVYLEGSDTW